MVSGLWDCRSGELSPGAILIAVVALLVVTVSISIGFGWVGSTGSETVDSTDSETPSVAGAGNVSTAANSDVGDSQNDAAVSRETIHVAGNRQYCRYQVPEVREPDFTVEPEDGASGIQRAINSAEPGDLIYLEGGTYEMRSTISIDGDGSEDDQITLAGKPGERPILDFSQMSAPNTDDPEFDFGAAVSVDGNYWTIRNVEVTESPGFGIRARGGENHLVFENVESHDNVLTGLALIESSHNEIRHSSFHHNYDPMNSGEHADGVGIKRGPDPESKTANENLVYCTDMYLNSDDGFDGYRSNDNDIFYSRAWENGKVSETELSDSGNGNGFKFGPYNGGGHLVVGNLAWGNVRKEEGEYAKATGFDYNGAEVPITLYHNTAWGNEMGFNFQTEGDTLVNNLAVGNDAKSKVWTSYPEEHNVFTTGGGRSTFQCTSPGNQTFLMPKPESKPVDAGEDVESVTWDTTGSAPDIGAVEFREQSGPSGERVGTGERCSRGSEAAAELAP